MGPVKCWSSLNGTWHEGDVPGAVVRWFDATGDDGGLEELATRFGLHPLAVEDCRSPLLHAPKIDEFPDHLFIVLLAAITPASDNPTEVAVEELDVFLGRDFLITYQDRRVDEVDKVEHAIATGLAIRPGADGLLYELADRVVDSTLPQVNSIAERLEAIEADVLRRPDGPAHSHGIVALRAQAGRIRRLLGPQLLVMQRLSRGEFTFVAESNRIYFRDIYDHMVRLDMALEGVRDDAEVVLSTYLSSLNNRMNEVMKVLSVVAALALPATVIAGIFGTNFDNVPALHTDWGFATMIGAMAGVMLGMAYYFHRRGWF